MSTPIILKYHSASFSIADEIANGLEFVAHTIVRQICDEAGVSDHAINLMQGLADNPNIILLISNEFLRSVDCMHGIMQSLQNASVLPVLIPGTTVLQPEGRMEVIEYWKGKKDEATHLLKKQGVENSAAQQEDIEKYTRIYKRFDEFLDYIKALHSVSFDELKSYGYKRVFELISDDPKDNEKLEILLKIKSIDNDEEQLINIAHYSESYPNDYLAWCLQGDIYREKTKKYRLSKYAYEKALALNQESYIVNNNYALLLENHFSSDFNDYEKVRHYYREAFSINPLFAEAVYNYARLSVSEYYNDKEEAKKYFEDALKLNPWHKEACYNYAYLLETYFNDINTAKKYYERVLSINPNHSKAHYSYGHILETHFDNKNGAKEHYEKALAIDPQHFFANYNYACLAETYFDDKNIAKEHYETALAINPNHSKAQYKYAYLLKDHFNDKDRAKEHLEKAFALDENNIKSAEAHYSHAYAISQGGFDDNEGAKRHLEIALSINENYFPALTLYTGMMSSPEEKKWAKEQYERFLTQDPNNIAILGRYASLLALEDGFNDATEAKEQFEKILTLTPNDGLIRFEYASFLRRTMTDKLSAKNEYLKAVSLSPALKTSGNDKYFGADDKP